MNLKHLDNLHERERHRIFKSLIPRAALRLYNYRTYKKRFPACFVSSESKVAKEARLGRHCLVQESYIGPGVKIGDFTTIGHQSRMGGRGRITIGKFCSIAPECLIWSENHKTSYPACYPFEHMLKGHNDEWEEYEGRDVTIGHSVWVGQRVIILAGAHIREGSVVASGAVVPAGEYPPFSLIGGVPGKVIKKRLSDEQRETLKTTRWWDRPAEEIFGPLMGYLHGQERTPDE